MLGGSCSPCCSSPCLSNQGAFRVVLEFTASNYFEQRTEVYGGYKSDRVTVDPTFEVTRKITTFFFGGQLNGTFVLSSSSSVCSTNGSPSSCATSNGILISWPVPGTANCCWDGTLSVNLYNNPEPTNYDVKFRTPYVRVYREQLILPRNSSNCQPPTHKDEGWFTAGNCCTNAAASVPGCAETLADSLLTTVTGTCSGGVLTSNIPRTVTAPVPAFVVPPNERDYWFLKSTTIDAQYGSLDVTLTSMTLAPI